MSANVGSEMPESEVIENVGVAIEIQFVVAMQTKETVFYADFKAFPAFGLPYWIPGWRQKRSETNHPVTNSYSGKITKSRPLIPSGSEMAAKIVVCGFYRGGAKIYLSPFCTRGVRLVGC